MHITTASTPREHVQHGLRGDHPGLVMEAPVRAFSGAEEVVFSGDVGLHSG